MGRCSRSYSMQRTMISWWLLKEKKITLLWRCRCLQVPHASVDGPHWWIHWHIYWTWYLSFLYVASANILTKCNLVRKRFIFCLWYQITTYHLGNQAKTWNQDCLLFYTRLPLVKECNLQLKRWNKDKGKCDLLSSLQVNYSSSRFVIHFMA